MDVKPDWTVQASCTQRLEEFAEATRRVLDLLGDFDQRTIDALDAAGWDSCHTFALRAELARAAEVAEKVTRGKGRQGG